MQSGRSREEKGTDKSVALERERLPERQGEAEREREIRQDEKGQRNKEKRHCGGTLWATAISHLRSKAEREKNNNPTTPLG